MDVDSSMTSSVDVDDGSNNNNSNSNGSGPEEQVDEKLLLKEESPSPVSGPRHAPNYSVVNAVLDKKEDGPGPRCGHTLTAVAAVGEEGSAGYMGPRLILFGGATALEGNSANAAAPTSPGGAGIRMFRFCFVDLSVVYGSLFFML